MTTDPEPWLCKGLRYPVSKCGDCEYLPRVQEPTHLEDIE